MRNILLSAMILILATACGNPAQRPESQGPSYQQIKEMIVDVLETTEGKKAIREMMKDPEFKKEVIIADKDVEKAIANVMQDPKSKKELETILKKREVAKNFAEVTREEQKKLMKQLMKDPEYQKLLLDVLRDPEFEDNLLHLMKSRQYRQEMTKVMEEALETPSFQKKFEKLLEEAVKKAEQKKEKSEDQNQDGGGQEQQEST